MWCTVIKKSKCPSDGFNWDEHHEIRMLRYKNEKAIKYQMRNDFIWKYVVYIEENWEKINLRCFVRIQQQSMDWKSDNGGNLFGLTYNWFGSK